MSGVNNSVNPKLLLLTPQVQRLFTNQSKIPSIWLKLNPKF